MQVSNPNNIKIYNLSAGKSLPEWLSDRAKRSMQKRDIDVRRRVELIQDFEMPTVSNRIQVSRDGQYIFATGVYKPRIRCYEVSQLSMKFERCMDCEIVQFQPLSDDYTKLVFLQSDRYVELHAQHGRYYRTRIPKFGRDFAFHTASCDLYFVGASPEVYRLNLEQGRFMNSLKTSALEMNCCQFNPVHHLFACGSVQGHVECWDPRTRNRVGLLDCATGGWLQEAEVTSVPGITALKFDGGLNMAVGTQTGQVLLYDLRSDKPLLVKDHQYDLPIRDLDFHETQDLVLSCDSRILKLWNKNTGKAYTSIEPGTEINDLCVVPKSGLLFMANEHPKMLTYYIPSLGPAPRWCSFLDSLTEELEENPTPSVYDDYRFVTRTELEGLGLMHLIGSNLLRAYMHGYFMDVRLYHKAKSIVEPFAYEEYRRSKIREKIEEARANRVKLKKLPKVNRQLAEKIIATEEEEKATTKKKKGKEMPSLLQDSRFAAMFSNPDFEVDPESEEYRLLNPVVSKMDKERKKKQQRQEALMEQFDQIEEEMEGMASEEEDSSDDDHTWTQEVKKQHRLMQREQRAKARQENEDVSLKPKFYELKAGEQFTSKEDKDRKKKKKQMQLSLSERLRTQEEDHSSIIRQRGSISGGMEMTFKLSKGKKEKKHQQAAKEHHAERRKIRRSAHDIMKHKQVPSKFWMGKRVT